MHATGRKREKKKKTPKTVLHRYCFFFVVLAVMVTLAHRDFEVCCRAQRVMMCWLPDGREKRGDKKPYISVSLLDDLYLVVICGINRVLWC